MTSPQLMNCKIVEADIDSDVEQIVEIDELSFDDCLTRSSVLASFGKKNTKMILCIDVRNNDVLGFMTMLRHVSRRCEDGIQDQISVTRIAVHPSTRVNGVGRMMVEKAIDMAKEIEASGVQFVVQVDTISIGTLCFFERMNFSLSATAGVLNIYELRL